MRVIPVVVLFCLAFFSAFAQEWKPAKAELRTGEIVVGEIFFKDWTISPSSIEFREGDGKTTSYTGEALQSFTFVEGKKKYSHIEETLKYYTLATVREGSSRMFTESKVSVFADVLYSDSTVVLYSLQDINKDERFFIRKDGILRELVSFDLSMEKDGRVFNYENRSFREQLKALLADCKVKIPGNMDYSERAMMDVMRKYSQCKGSTAAVEKEQQGGLVSIGVTAAPVFAKLNGLKASAQLYGVSLQVLSKRSFNNYFVWLDLGIATADIRHTPANSLVNFGFYTGACLGKSNFQPVIFSGISRMTGMFDTGLGIAYKKKVSLSASVGIGDLIEKKWQIVSVRLRVFPRLRARG